VRWTPRVSKTGQGRKKGQNDLSNSCDRFVPLGGNATRESKLGQPARYNHRFARWFFDNSTPCVPSGPSARTNAADRVRFAAAAGFCRRAGARPVSGHSRFDRFNRHRRRAAIAGFFNAPRSAPPPAGPRDRLDLENPHCADPCSHLPPLAAPLLR
jgi:hypothetical protein